VTGGAGFIGANLAVSMSARHPDWEILAVDNLRRRGAELNLARLREAGVSFSHADVRNYADLATLGALDVVIECSAEPSVLSGLDGAELDYLVKTNLVGAYHCLELARRHEAQLILLSTSRVYPLQALRSIRLIEGDTRFEIDSHQDLPGVSPAGISEQFPFEGARTLYGAAKLSAEHLVAEYANAFGLPTVVNRCGVVAGPWQMGRVDQGVFTYWMLAHHYEWPLEFIGYGGSGKQVRDVLHVDDLVDLIDDQVCDPDSWSGFVGNVGGGAERSLSLLELTERCRALTGHDIALGAEETERAGDVPVYISDCSRLHERTEWRPARTTDEILEDILHWIRDHERELVSAL
jgi:CDP-paratose 2-epimerase